MALMDKSGRRRSDTMENPEVHSNRFLHFVSQIAADFRL